MRHSSFNLSFFKPSVFRNGSGKDVRARETHSSYRVFCCFVCVGWKQLFSRNMHTVPPTLYDDVVLVRGHSCFFLILNKRQKSAGSNNDLCPIPSTAHNRASRTASYSPPHTPLNELQTRSPRHSCAFGDFYRYILPKKGGNCLFILLFL